VVFITEGGMVGFTWNAGSAALLVYFRTLVSVLVLCGQMDYGSK